MIKEKEKPEKVKKMIDIDAIVKKTQALYDKKEKGLAEQISTGVRISRPTDDNDFVLWPKGEHWKALTGLPGIPFGRIVQISGKPDSGKSTHAMEFMVSAQKAGHTVILWDTEKKFSPRRYNEQMGGKAEELLVINNNNIINGIKAVANLINVIKEEYPEQKVLVVWDSVGGSVNSTEDQEDSEDYSKQPGTTAREASYAVRKLAKLINKNTDPETGVETVSALIINQTYASIGPMSSGQIERGGVSIQYFSSIIIQLSRKQDLVHTKKGEKYKYGIVSRAKVKKNHLFDGNESVSEMDIVISADGVHLAKDIKSFDDLKAVDGFVELEDDD